MNGKACLITLSLLVLLGTVAQAQTPPAPAPPAPTTPPRPAPEPVSRYQREVEERLHNDWAHLARFREENARLGPPARGENRVVFMGDSITEGWGRPDRFFPGKPYVNRGISGKTTPQMLIC